MKRYITLLITAALLSGCASYYHCPNPQKFLIADSLLQDTFTVERHIIVDTGSYVFLNKFHKSNDTVYSFTFTKDSTFLMIQMFLIKPQAQILYSEFYFYGMNILFFEIKKNISFGLNPKKVGYINILKKLDAPSFYQKIRIRSIGSAMDTLSLGDSTFQALRVDVRLKSIYRNKKDKTKYKSNSILHFYYYPGYGNIFISSPNYVEIVRLPNPKPKNSEQ